MKTKDEFVTEVAMKLIDTIHECVKMAGPDGIPSGHLYAMLCGNISLHTYQGVVDYLCTAGKIESKGYLLKALM